MTKWVRTSINFSDRQFRKLRLVAAYQECSISELVRSLITAEICRLSKDSSEMQIHFDKIDKILTSE
jgi:hypothetical protein